ncbi:MAG: endonuclease/exonuclease/phosphatase family protein [Deltaproteobacteria bacterium]|nr:endonuclease/exonuclease/phosphatase family protein [Deltaproteobacteria bacterium]
MRPGTAALRAPGAFGDEELLALVQRSYGSARGTIIAGDFNTLDVEPLYRGITGSFLDVFATAGTGRGATFPSLVALPPWPVLRLDYVFTSPKILPLAAERLAQGGSDHVGIWARLSIPAGPLRRQ